MIVVVSDIFSNQYTGGAELTTDALLEPGFNNYVKINSSMLNYEIINYFKDKRWILFNYSQVTNDNLLKIIKSVKEYSIVEYDYKYCKYRLKSKHEDAEQVCLCENSLRGKLVALAMANSNNLFFMSSDQKSEYEKVFPVLQRHSSSHVLSSSFTEKNIEYILSLDTTKTNLKYLILNSDSWVKGTQKCIEYANNNNLEYELVGGLPHQELLKKLAKSKGLIFLPNGFDTCPRIVIEAKLLDCELILNENVQHNKEEWFKNKESIIEYVKKQKDMFYDMCLRNPIPHDKHEKQSRFVFIVPGYNAESWLLSCLQSIKKQEYENYKVVYIDDLSTDNSYEVFQKFAKDDERYTGCKNKTKKYALQNIEEAINNSNLDEEDIIILLDADDWLASADVLNVLNDSYIKTNSLVTYGSYMYYPTGHKGVEPSQYPQKVIQNNLFREDQWRASHLRTFKKKAWDKIDKKDFLDKDGNYFKCSYDQAIMLPLLEIVSDRSLYIQEILHVYNRSNALNVDKIKQKQQYLSMIEIRNKQKYNKVNFEN